MPEFIVRTVNAHLSGRYFVYSISLYPCVFVRFVVSFSFEMNR